MSTPPDLPHDDAVSRYLRRPKPMRELPECPYCQSTMFPAWGAYHCGDRDCHDYLEVRTQNDIDNALEDQGIRMHERWMS